MGNCLGYPAKYCSTLIKPGKCCGYLADNHDPIHIKPSNPVGDKERTIKQSKSKNKRKSGESRRSAEEEVPTIGQIITPNLKIYTYAELTTITNSFTPDALLGKGGFGTVHKGWVDAETYAPSKFGVGMAVAVKKSNPDGGQGVREWKAEVEFLGKLSHPNLVKLLGCCEKDNQFLLVYEYMEGGSLQSHLFTQGGHPPIPWDTRVKIAIGAARGLVFLHTMENQVIYRDFKAPNILLDGDFNAKLADFGLAKLGPVDENTHVSTRVMGTRGYIAPEYYKTGHLSVHSDVYSFGMVLLELLTGKKAVDWNGAKNDGQLIDWAKPSLLKQRNLKNIVDPRLDNQYPPKAAFQTTLLIQKCLEEEKRDRPSMDDVLKTLQQISSIEMNPNESWGPMLLGTASRVFSFGKPLEAKGLKNNPSTSTPNI